MAISSRLVRVCSVCVVLAACSGGGSAPPPSAPPPPAGGDTNLATLGLSVGELDQQFQPGVTSYTAKVGYLDNAVHIAVQSSDPAAVVRVNGTTVSAGTSERIGLAEGENAIEIAVENGSAQKSYSIELTRDTHASFAESAYVKASNPGADDTFGTEIALSGDTLIVGAPREDGSNDAASNSGAAYVFVRDAAGVWSQQAYLEASNADPEDAFGVSVAISGDLLAVGAPQEDSNATGVNGDQADNSRAGAGAVYLYARDASGTWTQEAYIKPQASHDGFGTSVALDGNTLVVGSWDATALGGVYVFTRDASGSWSEQALIAPSDGISDVAFGQALALDGDTLAVGAPFYPTVPGSLGAVYIFTREGSTWSEVTRLKGSDPEDSFGSSVALSADTLAVGAIGEDSGSVGIGGDPSDNTASFSGAVYLFDRDAAGDWTQSAYIKASNAEASDSFGYAVALSGDWLAVSADNEAGGSTGIGGTESDNSQPGTGAAYLFVRDGSGSWSQQLYIKASNAGLNDRFGRSSVALSRSTLVFAAPFEDSNASGVNGDGTNNAALDSGSVYVFE